MAQRALKASCLCKGVQFTLSGQDKGAVLCHCSNCKSFTGSAFAHNYRFMKAKVEYQKGEDLVKLYKDDNTKSGKVLERFFCGRCVSLPCGVFESMSMALVLERFYSDEVLTRRIMTGLITHEQASSDPRVDRSLHRRDPEWRGPIESKVRVVRGGQTALVGKYCQGRSEIVNTTCMKPP